MFRKNREIKIKAIMDPKKLVNKHFDILINNNKVKIIGYTLNNTHDIKNICLKTKLKGQIFPMETNVIIKIDDTSYKCKWVCTTYSGSGLLEEHKYKIYE